MYEVVADEDKQLGSKFGAKRVDVAIEGRLTSFACCNHIAFVIVWTQAKKHKKCFLMLAYLQTSAFFLIELLLVIVPLMSEQNFKLIC